MNIYTSIYTFMYVYVYIYICVYIHFWYMFAIFLPNNIYIAIGPYRAIILPCLFPCGVPSWSE